MARVLITGAGGLIGRRVVSELAAPHETIVIGRPEHDLLTPGAFENIIEAASPDAVLHLAWVASSTPGYRSHPDNVRWVDATIAAARRAGELGIRFIGVGTPLDTEPAIDAYTASKAATRSALSAEIDGGQLSWLRPFYVFDEVTPSPAVLRAALAAKEEGLPVELATPEARHDFIHVEDVASAIRHVLESGITGLIDVGSGVPHTVAELVEAHGARWVRSAEVPRVAGSESTADLGPLSAVGWLPTRTLAAFGDRA